MDAIHRPQCRVIGFYSYDCHTMAGILRRARIHYLTIRYLEVLKNIRIYADALLELIILAQLQIHDRYFTLPTLFLQLLVSAM